MDCLLSQSFTSTCLCLCIQRSQGLVDFYSKLGHINHALATIIHELVTARIIKMSMSSPSLTESRSREKLLVVRFLQAHLAHEGIDQHSYDMLYRMILMTSSLGRDLYAVSQANIADASIVKKMEWHAGCLLEGCEAFRRHLEKRLRNARHAATKLPELDGTTEEALTWKLSVWHDELR